MRTLSLLMILVAAPAAAQSARDWVDKVSKPGCCNRRPVARKDSLDAMPLAGEPSGRAVKLKTFLSGWMVAGSKGAYELSCDLVASNCGIAILRSTAAASVDTYGALLHQESAVPWRGSRVRLRTEVRSGGVDQWAGAWIRAQTADGKLLAARTMRSVPLKGTTSFTWVDLEFEVPPGAEVLSMGVELQGQGAVFVREVALEAAVDVVTSR